MRMGRSRSTSSSARTSCRSGTRSALIPSTFTSSPHTPEMPGSGRSCAGPTSIRATPSPSPPGARDSMNARRGYSRMGMSSPGTGPTRSPRASGRMDCPAAGARSASSGGVPLFSASWSISGRRRTSWRRWNRAWCTTGTRCSWCFTSRGRHILSMLTTRQHLPRAARVGRRAHGRKLNIARQHVSSKPTAIGC